MEVKEPSARYLAQPAFKQTEVGLIPEDWEVQSIGEICAIAAGRDLVRSEFSPFYDDNHPYPIYANALSAEGLYGFSSSFQYSEDSLTVTARGDVGHAMHRTSKFCAIGRVLVLTTKQDCDLRYLCQYINTCVSFALESTGVPQLTAPQISSYFVAHPPTLAEQQAIAGALSDGDALIESLEQLLTKKRQIKQGAMQELLTGQKRLPGFAGEWEEKRLGDVAQLRKERVDPRRTGTQEFCIELEHIDQGTGNLIGHIATGDGSSLKSVFREDDVLFGKLRAYLRKYWLATRGGVCSTEIWVLVAMRSILVPQFLFQLVKVDLFIEAASSAYGTHMPRSDWNVVKNYEVSLPSVAEQTAIATVLSDMDTELAALDAKLVKARQLKQGMMQELLTGRIRLLPAKAEVIPFPAQENAKTEKPRPHNRQIEEAVMLGVLAKAFGSEQNPLARVRRTKLLYLLHRHIDGRAEGYLKKAAGPYNPKTRYQGAEGIAVKNAYVRAHGNGTWEGFVAGDKVVEAEAYFDKWHEPAVRAWLEQFHYTKTEELELLATVDMAMEDLRRAGHPVALAAVKQIIASHPEWQAKLEKPIFSDANIERAITKCHNLFGN